MKKFIITSIALLVGASFLSAKVITVTSSESSGAGTLRQAIEDAESNDTIVFADNITIVYFAEMIDIGTNITINGNETNNTIFQNAPIGWTGTLSSTRYFYIAANTEVTFNHITMKDNNSHCSGGAINSDGKLIVNNCTFNNNRSIYDIGGAIFSKNNLIVMNCTFSNNSAASGGAMLCAGIATITNSLFTGNSGNDNSGGAIRVSGLADIVSVSNCTFVGNTSEFGAAISNYGNATLYNNIIWSNNGSYGDVYTHTDRITTAYNNIIGTSNTDLSGNGNIIGKNPLFAGNGNYSLQAGSPAINKGNNAYLDAGITVDLAGNPRINSGIVDMGAYEYQRSVNWGDSLVEVLQDSIAVLQQKNNVFYDSILTLHIVNSSLQTLSDSAVGALQDSIAVLEQKNSTFQDSILTLLNANSTLQNDNTNLQEENAALQEENSILRNDNRLLDSIAVLHEEIDMLNEFYDEMARRWVNESRTNKNLQNKNNVLRDSVTILLNANSALRKDNTILLEENAALQDSTIVLLDKIDLLQDSIYALLERLAECEASGTQSSLMPKSNVQVYPNPVYDKLQIVIPSEEQSMFINSTVELFDMSGKCVYSARINAAVDTFVIDMSSQKTGTYILRITQQNKDVSVMKIIKS